jgi:hypothetical protein
MFVLAVALWMVDVHNTLTEVRGTLVSPSTDTLANKSAAATTNILRLAAVEDILYSYMVC